MLGILKHDSRTIEQQLVWMSTFGEGLLAVPMNCMPIISQSALDLLVELCFWFIFHLKGIQLISSKTTQ